MSQTLKMSVVLVRSLYERNVGSVSRTMSNLGSEDLILIDPKCELTYEAQQAAATGQMALQNRRTYASWADFLASEPFGVRIGLTARDGRGRMPKFLRETLDDVDRTIAADDDPSIKHIYFVFGPEDWGLNREDLTHCQRAAKLPTHGPNTSYNLAHAVLLSLYIARELWPAPTQPIVKNLPKDQTLSQKEFPEELISTWLTTLGISLDKKKVNVMTVLRRMLLQNIPTEKEYRILEMVLQQTIRKLKEK